MDQYNAWSLLTEYSDALKKHQRASLLLDERETRLWEQRVVTLADQIVDAMTGRDE